MPQQASVSVVNERFLAEGLERLAAAIPGGGDLLDVFDVFIRTASDDELVRINPVHFGQSCGFRTEEVVELFLHARKLGLLTMEWQYVCPGCGEVVERLASLTSATAHYFCQVCSADRDADLSDFIEVTFSLSPEVRRSRYHDPWSLTPEEHFFRYRFTQSGVVDDRSSLRDHVRARAVACAYVEPGTTETFTVTAEPGYLWLTNGPALIVGDTRTSECRSFAFEYTGTRSKGFRAEIAAGPVQVAFTNATDERYALMITSLPGHYELTMQPFLSGAELLSNQTFLDLFATETIVAGEGLAVTRLALLFTDLQGSTALYDRIGDMKAFDLVRLHFGYLRECISRNSDAREDDRRRGDGQFRRSTRRVASGAGHAGPDRKVQRGRRRRSDRPQIGLHAGACLAVTLNDRLDYFGQTVNIAARVQALSGADEIVVTDDVLSLPGAAELVADLEIERSAVQLKGDRRGRRRASPSRGRSRLVLDSRHRRSRAVAVDHSSRGEGGVNPLAACPLAVQDVALG
jgi:class 3 adenylate cyclase